MLVRRKMEKSYVLNVSRTSSQLGLKLNVEIHSNIAQSVRMSNLMDRFNGTSQLLLSLTKTQSSIVQNVMTGTGGKPAIGNVLIVESQDVPSVLILVLVMFARKDTT